MVIVRDVLTAVMWGTYILATLIVLLAALFTAFVGRQYWCFKREEKQRKAWAREGRAL